MQKIEFFILIVISIVVFIVGALSFWGRQADIVNTPEVSAIESLVSALDQGKDISKPDLIVLLKTYSREAKSGRETTIFLVDFMRTAGLFLLVLAVLQFALLLKIVWRLKKNL